MNETLLKQISFQNAYIEELKQKRQMEVELLNQEIEVLKETVKLQNELIEALKEQNSLLEKSIRWMDNNIKN